MNPTEAREIIAYALGALGDPRIHAIAYTSDGLDITFTDGSVATVTVGITPAPAPEAAT